MSREDEHFSLACINRLQKEYRAVLKDPPPNIKAHPNPSNILEWHYVLEGQKGSEFEQGVYHGKLVFPSQYPFKAPGIIMLTPNGRFATGSRLCLSMSDFHPESWNPLWSVGTILNGLMSFMYEPSQTTGSIQTSRGDKQRLALQSLDFNLRNPIFRKLFPEYADLQKQRQQQQQAAQAQGKPRVEQGGQRGAPSTTSLSSILIGLSIFAIAASLILVPLTGGM